MNRTTNHWRNFFLLISPSAVFWATVAVVPLIALLILSFYSRDFPGHHPDFQFGNYIRLFTEPEFASVLIRTVRVTLLACLLCLVVGFPLAYFIAYKLTSARLRMLIYMAVLIPMWVSYLLRVFAWRNILGSEGALNSLLLWFGMIDEPLQYLLFNEFALILAIGYVSLPLMVIPIVAILEKIPASVREAAKDLGASPVVTFRKVTLPLATPGIVAGFTLCFCHAAGDFVSPILVGGPSSTMAANVILTQFGSALNWPLGAALTVLLLIMFISLIAISNRIEASRDLKVE